MPRRSWATPLPDGRWALLHRDRELTAAGLDEQHRGDGEAWLELCRLWDRIGDPLLRAVVTPFPPVRAGLRLATRVPGAGGLDLVRMLLTPAAELVRTRFGGAAPALLLSGNGGHADIPLDSPGSGLFGLLLTMLGQTVGFPVPRGGAGELTASIGTPPRVARRIRAVRPRGQARRRRGRSGGGGGDR